MGILNAIRFLTVLPLPIKGEIAERELGRSSAWFPLVGAMLGGLLFASSRLLGLLWPATIVNALVLMLWCFLTRGFHLDGLADTMDGLWGGRTREDKLEIMKDSRLGVFGALAIFCSLLLKFVLLGELGSRFYGRALVLALTFGRWIMLLAIFSFPAARKGGLGHGFKKHCRLQELAVGTVTALICVYLAAGLRGLLLLPAAGASSGLLALLITRSLGGLTGDSYGALCEFGEIFTLLLICLFIKLI